MKPLPTAVLKGYCLVEVSTVFTGPEYLVAELDLTWKEDLFPQGILSAITLVGGGAGDRGARARSKCEVGPPAQRRLPPSSLGCGVRAQAEGAEVLRVRSELTLFSLCVWSLMSSTSTCALEGSCAVARAAHGGSQLMRRHGLWWVNHRQRSRLGSTRCAVASNGGPAWVSCVPHFRWVLPVCCLCPAGNHSAGPGGAHPLSRRLLSRGGLRGSDCRQRSGPLLLGRLSERHNGWPRGGRRRSSSLCIWVGHAVSLCW